MLDTKKFSTAGLNNELHETKNQLPSIQLVNHFFHWPRKILRFRSMMQEVAEILRSAVVLEENALLLLIFGIFISQKETKHFF